MNTWTDSEFSGETGSGTRSDSEAETTQEATALDLEPTGGRHPVNVGHLVMGVAFVGLFLVWLLISTDTVEFADARWMLPAPWIAAGVAGLVASTLKSRSRTAQVG